MDYPDLAPLEEISGPFALLSKGPKFIAAWLTKRTEERYEEFTRAALEGGILPENAEAMTSEDFLAMVRALELDIEAEKATLYGRLASSIATGKIAGHLKREFMRALSDLSFAQVELLRRALIAGRHQIFPGIGGGNLDPKEFLGLNGKPGFNRKTFERWALLDEKGLSLMGRKFVEACFASGELEPSAVGFQKWAKGQIHIVCNEMDTPACYDFLLKLDEVGHAKAIRVHHGAALLGRSNRLLTPGPVMVVLLTDKPQRLADEWTTVEDAIRGRALTVVAMTNPSAPVPAAMEALERVDASPDRASEAVTAILERFEAKGLRGT
jgi:hypothetical protein